MAHHPVSHFVRDQFRFAETSVVSRNDIPEKVSTDVIDLAQILLVYPVLVSLLEEIVDIWFRGGQLGSRAQDPGPRAVICRLLEDVGQGLDCRLMFKQTGDV